MYCPKCGNKEEGKNVKFCSKCGESLVIKGSAKSAGDAAAKFDVNDTTPEKAKRVSEIRMKRKVFTPKSLALIATFVLVFGLGVFIGVRMSTSEAASSTNSLVGTWVKDGSSHSFTLEEDGTVYDRTCLLDITETDGEIVSWSVSSENELVIIDSWRDRYYFDYSISGNTLTLTYEYINFGSGTVGESTYTFTRS